MRSSPAVALFRKTFGVPPVRTARAPGILTLLGHEADQFDGLTLAAATQIGVEIAASPRKDGRIEWHHSADPTPVRSSVHSLFKEPVPAWAESARSMIRQLERKRVHFSGFNAVFHSELGVAAGELYPDSALAIAMALVLRELFPFSLGELGADFPPRRDDRGRLPDLTPKERKLLARIVPVARSGGNPDLSLSVAALGALLARPWHLQVIDARFGTAESVPFPGTAIVLAFPFMPGASPFDSSALIPAIAEALQALMARSVRSLDPVFLRANRARLSEEQSGWARHLVGENHRAVAVERSLREEDHRQLGHYLVQSLHSRWELLRSPHETIRALAEEALRHPACLGVNETPVGTGLICLAAYHEVEGFTARLEEWHQDRTGQPLALLVVQPSEPATSGGKA